MVDHNAVLGHVRSRTTGSRVAELPLMRPDPAYIAGFFGTRTGMDHEQSIDLLSVETLRSGVLNRQAVELLLVPQGKPYKMDFLLSSKESFILFGADYPFLRRATPEEEAVSYQILVGKNPPNPLRLSLTLPEGGSYLLSVDVAYREPPFRLEFAGENKEFLIDLIYREEIEL